MSLLFLIGGSSFRALLPRASILWAPCQVVPHGFGRWWIAFLSEEIVSGTLMLVMYALELTPRPSEEEH